MRPQRMFLRRVIFCCLAFPLLSCCRSGWSVKRSQETVKIVSFNIQIFGVAKMAKPQVAYILADIVSQADITAIQEVRSAAVEPVERFMALLPEISTGGGGASPQSAPLPKYSYALGPREGRSSSKEQFLVIYDNQKFTLLGMETYPDPEDLFERNPLGLYFKTKGSFDFILISNHIKPGDAAQEINALDGVVTWFGDLWDESDTLILGDFNADGIYYDETELAGVFPEERYSLLITNDYDTTVAPSDNTYDRIIITTSAREDYAGASGVWRFEELYDLESLGVKDRELSDHYPVWADFYLNRDTD